MMFTLPVRRCGGGRQVADIAAGRVSLDRLIQRQQELTPLFGAACII